VSASAPGLGEAKRHARLRLRKVRASLPRATREHAESRIHAALDTLLEGSVRVGLYAAAGSEASLDTLARGLALRGVELAWPRVDRDMLRLHVSDIDSLEPGYRGLREPPAAAPERDPRDLDALLVPGLGFDRHGRRLGQGGGYYDRILPLLSPGVSIGVCFAVQVIPWLPTGPHDVTVDRVVTETARATGGRWHGH
jgi:5-formyltetrahydrofolate cyclo-ligase